MATPVIAGTAESQDDSNTENHSVDLPASISAGELLLGFVSVDGSPAIGWPVGWNEILEFDQGTNVVGSVAWREADGLESSPITVTSSSSQKSAHVVYRITGAVDPDTQAPEASSVSTGTDDALNSLSLTPTGGAKDYLWFSAMAKDGADGSITAPTNYGALTAITTTTTGACELGVASRALNATSENPGAFGTGGTDQWAAVTLAVHPVAAAGGDGTDMSWPSFSVPPTTPIQIIGY